MKVLLRNPKRELEMAGPVNVLALVRKLGYNREAVLVIVDGTLVTGDATIPDAAQVELRPVVSGGAVQVELRPVVPGGAVQLTPAFPVPAPGTKRQALP